MKTNKNKRSFSSRIPRSIGKFFNLFFLCSQQSRSCLHRIPSETTPLVVSTTVIRRKTYNHHRFSQTSLDFHRRQSTSYPRLYHSIDQEDSSDRTMPQIRLVDAEICTQTDETMKRQDDVVSFSPSSSSLSLSSSGTSNCQSLLTIHDCYSKSRPEEDDDDDENQLDNNNDNMLNTVVSELQSTILPISSTHFSYLIRPSTPCIFGQEDYDDNIDDDEFFLTAGGIVHSCPNIYELSIENNRKRQSCGDLLLLDSHNTLIHSTTNNEQLNAYDTELNRYSIVPRFQTMISSSLSCSSSLSTDSMNSELKLKKERHALGLCRQHHNDIPTNWKSDNHLYVLPIIDHHRRQFTSTFDSIDLNKRSRSHDIPIEPIDLSSKI